MTRRVKKQRSAYFQQIYNECLASDKRKTKFCRRMAADAEKRARLEGRLEGLEAAASSTSQAPTALAAPGMGALAAPEAEFDAEWAAAMPSSGPRDPAADRARSVMAARFTKSCNGMIEALTELVRYRGYLEGRGQRDRAASFEELENFRLAKAREACDCK